MAKQAKNWLIISEVGAADASQIGLHVLVMPFAPWMLRGRSSSNLTPSLRSRFWWLAWLLIARLRRIEFKIDLRIGTLAAMRHLIGSSCRRIVHAAFGRNDAPHESRRLEYLRAMREAGMEPEFIYDPLSETQRPIARKLIRDCISNHGQPAAVFCHSDDAALGDLLHVRLADSLMLLQPLGLALELAIRESSQRPV